MNDAAIEPSLTLPSPPAPGVTFRLLGYPELILNDAPLAKPLPAKALALLAYLAVERQFEHSREELATLLWPEAGRASLRQTLSMLRQTLPANPPLLQISRQTIGIDPAVDLWLDTDAFAALIERCQTHVHRRLDACPACVARLEEAVALYRGDFLAGFTLPDSEPFDLWQTARQETLRGQLLDARSTLAVFRTRRGEYGQAIDHLQQGLAVAPWQEESHRQLMRVLALDGQRSAALNQYELCRRQLADDLDVAPAAATIALRTQIEAGLLDPEAVEGSNPYRGLFPFDQEHATDFYGRDQLVHQLITRVAQQPLVAVVGPSGCGKSSLLRAGLLPKLDTPDATFSVPAAPRNGEAAALWTVVDCWPGSDPFHALAEALAPLLSTPTDSAALADALRLGERSLVDLAAELTTPDGSRSGRVLIIVDQFEELYTLCPDAPTRRAFLDLLLQVNAEPALAPADPPAAIDEVTDEVAANPKQRPPITVLIALRADFVGPALRYRPLADALQQGGVLVGPMSPAELRQVVEQPAHNRGAHFEAGLVDRVLADVGGDSGNLPLLQFCLTQLWGQQRDGALTHEAYDDIGGVAGALSRYAEQMFGHLSDDEQELAHQTLIRLVQPGESTTGTRRWANRQEMDETGWDLVQKMADARLVVTDRTLQGQEQAALVHEALIQHWARLQAWLRADQTLRLWQHRLWPLLREWEATGRDESALLRGLLLVEAEALSHTQRDKMSELERRFIDASIAQRDQRQAELEARRLAELEQAQALAQSERRQAEAANRTKRRLGWMTAGLTMALLLALLAMLAAANQGRVAQDHAEMAAAAQTEAEDNAATAVQAQAEAEREGARAEAEAVRAETQAQLALSRQLAAQAISLADEELDTALLLGLESLGIAPSSADRTALHADLSLPPFLSTILYGPPEPIYFMSIDPEGETLITVGERSKLVRWDVASGQTVSVTLPVADASHADPNEPRAFALSPDGRLVAEVHGPGLTLWDLDREEPLYAEAKAHDTDISKLHFAADAKHLFSKDGEGNIRLWDVDFASETSGSRLLARFTAVEDGVFTGVSPTGDKFAMTLDGESTMVLIWDVEAGAVIGEPMSGHTAEIHGWTFSPDGNLLATASYDGSVRLWDAAVGAPLLEPLLAHDGRVLSVAFSPDGKTLASGGTDGFIYLWDTATGELAAPPLAGHGNWVRALRYRDDGETLFTSDADGKIVAWDVGGNRTLRGHEDRVRGVGVSPDGRFLITSSFDGDIVRWDAESGAQVGRIENAIDGSIIQIAVSSDGVIASGGLGVVKLWDIETLSPLPSPTASHDDIVIGMAFSPDGDVLATGDFDGVVRLWDVATGEPIGEPVLTHEGWALSLAISPDGALLASGGTEGHIKLWQMPTAGSGENEVLEQIGETMTGHENWVTWLTFSPDGETLVSTSSDRTIRLWDVMAGTPQGEPLDGHKYQVWGAHFDPMSDGQVLVTLGGDGSVLRWDVASRELLGPPLLTGIETENMALSPDGRSLILGSFDETATQWRLDAQPWNARACRIANRNLDEDEWQQFMGEKPYDKICPELP